MSGVEQQQLTAFCNDKSAVERNPDQSSIHSQICDQLPLHCKVLLMCAAEHNMYKINTLIWT